MKKIIFIPLLVILISGCHLHSFVYSDPYKGCAEIASPLDTIKKMIVDEGCKPESIVITTESIKFGNYKELQYSDIKDVKISVKNSANGEKYYVRLFLTLGYHNKTEFIYTYDKGLAIKVAHIFGCLTKNK